MGEIAARHIQTHAAARGWRTVAGQVAAEQARNRRCLQQRWSFAVRQLPGPNVGWRAVIGRRALPPGVAHAASGAASGC